MNALSERMTSGRSLKSAGIKIFTIVGTMGGQLVYPSASALPPKQESLNETPRGSADMTG